MGQTQSQQYVVIVAGGTGTRLWPLSRTKIPKQFLSLVGEGNFLQQSFRRACKITSKEKVFIVAPDHFSQQLPKFLPEFVPDNFIGEPLQKGTTAAFGFAAVYLTQIDPQAIQHIIASDDYLVNDDQHAQTLLSAAQIVEHDQGVVIYGVKPSYPNTGYGYVKVNIESAKKYPTTISYKVESFREKPDLATAQSYLSSGNYFWHTFGFSIKAAKLIELIKHFEPSTYDVLSKIEADLKMPSRLEKKKLEEHYLQINPTNIENAVLEKASEQLTMITLEDTWNDVGSWETVYKLRPKDIDGNVVVGDKSKVIQVDSTGNLVATSGKPIVLAGANNLAVIDTGDIILITPLDQSQKVKQAVAKLKESKLEQYL